MRSKEYRNNETKKIIESLCKLNLNPSYDPIKQLYKQLQQWKLTGLRQTISIEFPEIHKKIVGILSESPKEPTWIKLEKLL